MNFKRFEKVNVIIDDIDFLKNIPIRAIRMYLEENQWEPNEDGFLYKKNNETVSLPSSITENGYGILVKDFLKHVSKTDDKNQLTIVEEIFEFQKEIEHDRNFFAFINRTEEEPSKEQEEAEEKELKLLRKEYERELTDAVEKAKEYNERRFNHSGTPHSPLWEDGHVIAVFRKYWLKTQEFNERSSGYYNPKWLAHEDLTGELYDIIDAMPYYPIGINEDGGYC